MMKPLLACLFFLLAAICKGDEGKTAKTHLRGEQQRERRKVATLGNADEEKGDNEESATRMFVEYANENGKQHTLSNAEEVIKDLDEENVLVVTLNKDSISDLENDDGIKSIEIDYPMVGFQVNHEDNFEDYRDLLETSPYGISMVEADLLDVGSFTPTVCIVDSGYALGHPDLPSDPEIVSGTSRHNAFGNTQDWPWNVDMNGHGTHIAGVISAIAGNDIGVAGAGNIKLHIARGLSDKSRAYESDILEAVQDCVDANANIISLSLGGRGMSSRGHRLFTNAVEENNMLVVAAAGNQGQAMDVYPASNPSVISVVAVDAEKQIWRGSNLSDQVELAAPGHKVLSTTTTNDAVHASDFSFPATKLEDSVHQEVSGNLINCGSGTNICEGAQGEICLMVRDSSADVANMVKVCETSGGVGAILFSNDGSKSGWQAETSIPAVMVSKSKGRTLLSRYVNQQVSIGYRDGDEREFTYNYFSGTSMAVPHVAAVSALVWSHFPQCTNRQIRYALDVSAEDLGSTGCDPRYGYGIVKAKAAYDFLTEHGCSNSFGQDPSAGGCRTV